MGDTSDYLGSLGALSLTLRMRRLADRLSEHGRAVYSGLEFELEPGWYAPLLLLDARGPLSISAAACLLGVRHPTMVKLSHSLEAAGLVASIDDETDGRRRLIRLTPRAQRRLPEFRRVWAAFEEALSELINSTGGQVDEQIAQLESLLDARGLDARVRSRLQPASRPPKRSRPVPEVRSAVASDREAVVDIAHELLRSGDTYAYAPDISDDDLWTYWAPTNSGDGFVATLDDEVVGMFVLRPNHPGPGSHVANASFAVRADQRGLGLGRAMGEASLTIAQQLGYAAMQFNIVVSTNEAAVRLWQSLGFRIVGTVPAGFRLPDGRTVPHHIMFRCLD